jgi:outer membrane murein-binding lipoprotein Lpp
MSIVWAAALAAGCSSRGQLDVLESRLRRQEDTVVQLQTQLSKTQSQLQAARREATELETQVAATGRSAPIEQVSALGKVEGIAFSKFLTGGMDRDGVPGDEILSAVVVPTDSDGNLVKVPGNLSLSVLDLSKGEGQQQIGRWDFPAKESVALWHAGFLGTGYVVRVPWQRPPGSANLLVHARLTTADGRQFDTSQSIRITPPPSAGPPLPIAGGGPPASSPAPRRLAGDGRSPAEAIWGDDNPSKQIARQPLGSTKPQ